MSKCRECDKYGVFDVPGMRTGRYCGEHKKPGMINVRMIICEAIECITAATCNYPNSGKAIRCSKHKLDGMVDVKHKHCELCDKVANQKFPTDKSPSRCLLHILPGMIGADNRKCKECNIGATFGYENTNERLYCRQHKKANMIDLVSQKCKNAGCNTQVYCHSNMDYCYTCYHALFPDAPIVRNHNTKEKAVAEFIFTKFNIHKERWVADQAIKGGNSFRRPDLFGDYTYFVIIVDIDERQHKFYDAENENKRNQEIAADVGNRPIIHIRFNPDTYKNANGVYVGACWKKDANNILNLENEIDWNNRLYILQMVIAIYIFHEPKTSQIIQLFFDDFDNKSSIFIPHDNMEYNPLYYETDENGFYIF
jgi:hypothetical protein